MTLFCFMIILICLRGTYCFALHIYKCANLGKPFPLIEETFNNGPSRWVFKNYTHTLINTLKLICTIVWYYFMMTSSNENIFRVSVHLCGEFTSHRWIPRRKGQLRGNLMFSLIGAWINGWVNNGEAGDLRRHRDHCNVIVMYTFWLFRDL